LGKSVKLMERWSKRHRWVARAREFDNQATRIEDESRLELIAKRSARQAKEAEVAQEYATFVLSAALRRLANSPQILEDMPAAELMDKATAAGRMLTRAIPAERLALGISTENPQEPLPRSLAEEAARRMTLEELEARLTGVDELAERRARKAA
jgi:hypothetical protein